LRLLRLGGRIDEEVCGKKNALISPPATDVFTRPGVGWQRAGGDAAKKALFALLGKCYLPLVRMREDSARTPNSCLFPQSVIAHYFTRRLSCVGRSGAQRPFVCTPFKQNPGGVDAVAELDRRHDIGGPSPAAILRHGLGA